MAGSKVVVSPTFATLSVAGPETTDRLTPLDFEFRLSTGNHPEKTSDGKGLALI